MAQVTVGLPVFNGAEHLAASLDCILGQTFRDLEILIFDNASTDETPQIVASYAARDPRIRYVRQPFNKGAIPNFGDVVRAAKSPYFLWRAADDLSEPNYIEALHGLLERHPEKNLAVGRMVESLNGRLLRERDALRLGGSASDRLSVLFDAPASTIYGLFRRAALTGVMERISDRYGEPAWGWDYLALLPFFFDDAVVQTDATAFAFSVRGGPRERGQRRPPRKEADFDAMLGARRRFLTIASEFADERYPPGPRRLLAHAIVWVYANKRVYKIKRIIRRTIRRWIGLKP